MSTLRSWALGLACLAAVSVPVGAEDAAVAEEDEMEITLTQAAIDEGILRVWLRRIPDEGGFVHVFFADAGEGAHPVGTAALYGRGFGSTASERVMLAFRLFNGEGGRDLRAGDRLRIRAEAETDGAYEDIMLDILEVE